MTEWKRARVFSTGSSSSLVRVHLAGLLLLGGVLGVSAHSDLQNARKAV